MPDPLINITRKHAIIFAMFLVLYEFLTYIANDMIMPGMIHVVASFHAPESAIATSLTAYILGGASLQLLLGPVSDFYGRRPVMLVGAVIFFAFTLLIACSTTISQFLVMRFFEGMGLCFISVIGYATIQEIFSEMDAIRLIAIMANISIIAPLLGPLAGATFIHFWSWRFIFILIGLLSLVALWGLWRFMPEPVGAMKRDGERMHRTPLSFSAVTMNYKTLFCNKPFMLGTIAYSLLAVPCVAWIALSPVMLVTSAKLSLIQYALWQVPPFGACILGNIVLRKMTHDHSLKKLIVIGSILAVVSLVSLFLFSMIQGGHYIWLMPGLMVYFFTLGLTAAPLDRFILYATKVSKGTASAVISITAMIIQALGVEIVSHVYSSHNNQFFALYCAMIGIVYMIFLAGAFLCGTDLEAGC